MIIRQVEACWDSELNGLPCLESATKFGFFTKRNDRRPSSCYWVDKLLDNSIQAKLGDFI